MKKLTGRELKSLLFAKERRKNTKRGRRLKEKGHYMINGGRKFKLKG